LKFDHLSSPSPIRGSWAKSADPGAIGRLFSSARILNPAWLTLLASLALSLLGIYAIDLGAAWSASAPDGNAPGLSSTALRQAIFLPIGLLAALVVATPHYRWLGYFSWVLAGLVLAFLIFLLIPGVPTWLVTPRNGARGWISLGIVDFQPAELAKIAFTLVVAWYLRFRKNHRRFIGLIPPGLIAAGPIALITLQPDLGTACLFVPVLFAMLVAAGAKLRHLAIIVLLAAMALPASYPVLRPHQQERILGLIKQLQGDKSADQDINMQSVTAQRLIAAGGSLGMPAPAARALVHFNRLPERHNDMIFAVISTRFGFVGGLILLAIYLLWILGAILTAASTHDPFGRLICVGLAAFTAAQVFINVGMNLGVLPIIGITLPFISYGGSSLVTVWAMSGLIFSVALRRPRPPFRESFDYDEDD
jgi:rod shape determining protein RodA